MAAIPAPPQQGNVALADDPNRTSYSATKTGLVLAASATDVAVLTGSASKLVRVTHVEYSGLATTILNTDVQLIVRTTADSGGTATAPAVIAHDQTASGTPVAATAVMSVYTANPTVNDGTARPIRSQKALHNLAAPAAGSESTRVVWDFMNRPSQAIILRGIAQQLAINLNGVTVAGGNADITFEWTEE